MWYEEKDNRKEECTFSVNINFDFGHRVYYERENYIVRETSRTAEEWQVIFHPFVINREEIESITLIEEFWDKFLNRKLYTLYNESETVDIDEAMTNLAKMYGEDFIPDEKEMLYTMPDGTSFTGEELSSYFQSWTQDKFEKELFYETYKLYCKFGKPIGITITFENPYVGDDGWMYEYEIELGGKQLSWLDSMV